MRAGVDTPLGALTVEITGCAVSAIEWRRSPPSQDGLAQEVAAQLAAYFAGARETFALPLRPEVSGATASVLEVISAIPFGETLTYGDVARRTGLSAQAVGQACGANPIPIVIPCHRILGTGSLGGYSGAGGIETKVWLLRHEGAAGLLI